MKKILKFYSEWCGPCKAMGKALETLKNVTIQEVDIEDEDNTSLIEEWKIRTIPTIVILDEDNTCLAEFKGAVPLSKIQEVLDGNSINN